MKYTRFAFVALVVLFTGCEEYYAEKDSEPDGSNPFITISAPAENSVFTSTQAIKIESLISDKDKVKELEVQVVKLDVASNGNGVANNTGNNGVGNGNGNGNNGNGNGNSNKTSNSGNKAMWSFKQFPTKNPVVIDTAIAAAGLPAGSYMLTLVSVDGRTNVGTKEIKFTVK